MNCCPSPAEYVVCGGAESKDGEPVLVVLGACKRHVLAVKSYLAFWEPVTGEPVLVCGVEAWIKANWSAVGEDVRSLVEIPGSLVRTA